MIKSLRITDINMVEILRISSNFSLFWKVKLTIFLVVAISLGNLCSIPMANAHVGLDPEIEKITDKLIKDPDNVDLLIRRGQIHRSNHKFNESLQDFDRAWLLDRENQGILLQRALTLSAMNRNQEAEEALTVFLQNQSDPKRIFALAERAHIRARTGRIDLAIADFTAAIELQPTIELYLTRGELQESKGRLEEAAVGYQEGLNKLGDALLLKQGLIRVLIAQGHYNEALKLINNEIERSSVKTDWFLQQADIYKLMGQAGEADLAHQKALSEANRVLGKRSTAMQLLARAKVYQAMGQNEQAITDLRAAIQKAPRFSEAEDLLNQLELESR